jgi:hypothetical protein
VFSPETADFLHSGCALIVAVVNADLEPRATRGWGLDVLGGAEIRVLLDADDTVTFDFLDERDAIAVTATSVRTLHSIQLKGRCLALRDSTERDHQRAARYCDEFFVDVVETDGFDRVLLDRLVPRDYVACTVRVEEVYDQTPGPGAGATIPPRSA